MASEEDPHASLFTTPVIQLGELHWFLLHAAQAVEKHRGASGRSPRKDGSVGHPADGDSVLGAELGVDEIHWWVFKRETDVTQLLAQTELALTAAEALKLGSDRLLGEVRKGTSPNTYDDLLFRLRDFADQHASPIAALHHYVAWLYRQHELAPSILFNYRTWGSTRMGDRWTDLAAARFADESAETRRGLSLIVLGLYIRMPTLYRAQLEVMDDIVTELGLLAAIGKRGNLTEAVLACWRSPRGAPYLLAKD